MAFVRRVGIIVVILALVLAAAFVAWSTFLPTPWAAAPAGSTAASNPGASGVSVLSFFRNSTTPPAATAASAPRATVPPTVPPTAASAPRATVPATAPPTTAAIPRPAATPTAAPAATRPAAPAVSIGDLTARARQAAEYSFAFRVTASGQTTAGKAYLKGTKMRQEMSAGGQNVVMLIDTAQKVAYMVMVDQKAALKVDFGQMSSQLPNPGDQAGMLPADAKPVGTDTIDGKPAAVFELASGSAPGKYWMWTERGLPLKVELQGTPQSGPTTMEYLEYQFGSLADSLFELPAGFQVTDMSNPAGVPGKVPGISGGASTKP